MVIDDERTEIIERFHKEGLDHKLPDQQKLIHVWRWLVDAETNCISLRHQLDKVRRQQGEELKEVDIYVEHIRKLSDQKIYELEEENKRLRDELDLEDRENGEIVSREIRQMLIQEGLSEIANLGVSEQFAYLIVERTRMKEELEQERESRHKREQTSWMTSNLPDSVKLNSPQVQMMLEQQKDEYEEELKHQQETMRHLKQQLRQFHENELSQIKQEKSLIEEELISAKKKMEALVHQLAKSEDRGEETELLWIKNILNGGLQQRVDELELERDELKSRCHEQQRNIRELGERIRLLEKTNTQLELDNETLAYKLSESLVQYDELEDYLRKEKTKARRESVVMQKSSQMDSFHSSLDHRKSSHQELVMAEKIERLQVEINQLQTQLSSQGQQLEIFTVKYQQRKARYKERMRQLKDYIIREQQELREKEESWQQQLNYLEEMVNREQSWRAKLEADNRHLQEERRKLVDNLMEKEEEFKVKCREMKRLLIQQGNYHQHHFTQKSPSGGHRSYSESSDW
ncbi:uncharacterized protein LOC143230479 isoform X2 [Tachypleus tridentatus]|uniref:uncharacterized protein LOC143230479 isoform X2 n=1 Tax=Tachypleus tridentatus TaxID=6853 RepID=UPI003FD37D37